MKKVCVKIICEDGVKLPEQMTIGSSGMDVYAFISEPIVLNSLERTLVRTGIRVEIPLGYEIQVRPRSGLAIKYGISLLNTPGTIDSDYRGEIKVIVANLSCDSYTIMPLERIAQFVLVKIENIEWQQVHVVAETERSTGGFGHTGKN